MVGLGVGIDYALLLVVRHVENLRLGHDVGRGGRPGRRDRRPVGGVRRRHRARLADGPAARRVVDLRLVRPGDGDRRGVRRRGRAHPGAGAVPARGPQAAAPCRTPEPARAQPGAAHRPLGGARRAQPARLGAGQPGCPAGAGGARCSTCAPGPATRAASPRRRPPDRPTTWSRTSSGPVPTVPSPSSCRRRRRGRRGGGGRAGLRRPHRARRAGGHDS